MDEKTEALRDIFLDVAEEETVTESQEDERGSLTAEGESIDARLESVIERLDEKFPFSTAFSNADRCHIVRRFYAGDADSEIAEELEVDEETVFDARLELHLVRDSDTPDGEILAAIRAEQKADGSVGETDSVEAISETHGIEERVVRRTQRVLEAENRSRRVSQRFRTAFEEILTDADLTIQFTADTHADGLEDATEGAETNVDF